MMRIATPSIRHGRAAALLLLGALTGSASPALAQPDANFMLPPLVVEHHLRELPFEILNWRGSRMPEDRTQRAVFAFPDSSVLLVKWANAAQGASAFNNEPRFEIAAYELQKLFLDPDAFVVPPTVLRALDHEFVTAQMPGVPRTFRDAASVLVTLQYWLSQVTPDNFWDARRAESDSLYARHIGNFNTLTYLVRHGDANVGNFLISEYAGNPRVFAVDNGVAFSSPPSDRGATWRDMRVRRLSAGTVARLRALTRADLDRALGVLAEYEVRDGRLVAVPPGENIDHRRGVRRRGDRIQLGLTRVEIDGVASRLRNLLNQVERGRITEL
jgi:hypothetical protein